MAGNFFWGKESFNPGSDVENPSVFIDNVASPTNNHNTPAANAPGEGISRSPSKAVKLGLVIAALSVAIVLGMVLGRNGSSRNNGVSTSASSQTSIAQQSHAIEISDAIFSPGATGNTPTVQAVVESEPDNVKLITTEYYTSAGPLKARVRMASPSILNGYETCADLESDIAEALKLYMNEFIMNEAEVNEIDAICDTGNDSWHSDLYGFDFDYNDHQLQDGANATCSPNSNNTVCATDNTEVPWAVTWFVLGHAEGELFYNETQARVAYDNVNSSWAKRLYDPLKTVVDEYGIMEGSEWCQLETWSYKAQCNGKTPTSFTKKKSDEVTKSSLKMRSSILNISVKQTRNRNPRSRTNSHPGDGKASSKASDSYGQNSQTHSANEQDKVVSDGTYIYGAYGDVLYAWTAADSTKGVSITNLTEKFPENECDLNSTSVCTSISKPFIRTIFLSDSHLTVIISQGSWDFPDPVNYTPPIITDYGNKYFVVIYDISKVTLGLPLKAVGHKQITGVYFDGRSIGKKIVIATEFYIDTYVFTSALYRDQPQYCGLDSASYEKLAAEIADNQVESFAKQMVAELELMNDCSRIIQVSMMGSSIEGSDLTGADILGRFIQVTMFDVSTDFSAKDGMPLSVVGAFIAGYGYSLYLADDFLAVPSIVSKYNYSSGTDSAETFILGFDLSTNLATPFCYGHIPAIFSNKYSMDLWDGHLRIAAYDYFIVDTVNLREEYANKVYVFELPNIQDGPGMMSLVGETDFADKDGRISGVRFVEDKAYIAVSTWWPQKKNMFFVVDLSDHKSPTVVGHLNTSESISYLQQIDINNVRYILGVLYEGYDEMDYSWKTFMKLYLIDINSPFSPKMITSYKGDGSFTDAANGLAIRYLPNSSKLIVPVSKFDYSDSGTYNYTDGFTVYDISNESITPAFDVAHSTAEMFCQFDTNGYDPSIPARSFVILSKLITIKGHIAISSDMRTGRFVSRLDLDDKFNYSNCDYYGNSGYEYGMK